MSGTSTGDCLESTSIIFEWTIKGLKNLFESSRGESKSRVTRSARFGGGKWQILFYANSGEGNFVSLYLNCEPTQEEKDKSINGKWVREGLFKFSFELRNAAKTTLFNMKEACDHTFSYRTQNWGWAQFSKRDHVYYASSSVRQSDSFVVICTITASPVPPVPQSRIRRKHVPIGMLDVIGSLLDDPTYSDVEFVFPRRTYASKDGGPDQRPIRRRRPAKRIFATKRLLTRAEYFDTLFNSGFSETAGTGVMDDALKTPSISESEFTMASERLHEDSDLDDEAAEAALDIPQQDGEDETADVEEYTTPSDEHGPLHKFIGPSLPLRSAIQLGNTPVVNAEDPNHSYVPLQEVVSDRETMTESALLPPAGDDSLARSELGTGQRDGSPETVMVTSVQSENPQRQELGVTLPGPPKTRVLVNDVAYTTYRAVLYYLYTDSIQFSPLASSFLHAKAAKRHSRSQSQRVTADLPADVPRDGEESMSSVRPGLSRRTTALHGHAGDSTTSVGSPTTRAQWIKSWSQDNQGRPTPVSAKAVFRLADKLDLAELKERAREHIIKSLTITNVPHEVFSAFSATFEEIRKVQIDFFLANWGEIRGSEAMGIVWGQIRTGRHPGFEDVWPLIAQNLEYRASLSEPSLEDGERESQRDGMVTE